MASQATESQSEELVNIAIVAPKLAPALGLLPPSCNCWTWQKTGADLIQRIVDDYSLKRQIRKA